MQGAQQCHVLGSQCLVSRRTGGGPCRPGLLYIIGSFLPIEVVAFSLCCLPEGSPLTAGAERRLRFGVQLLLEGLLYPAGPLPSPLEVLGSYALPEVSVYCEAYDARVTAGFLAANERQVCF